MRADTSCSTNPTDRQWLADVPLDPRRYRVASTSVPQRMEEVVCRHWVGVAGQALCLGSPILIVRPVGRSVLQRQEPELSLHR